MRKKEKLKQGKLYGYGLTALIFFFAGMFYSTEFGFLSLNFFQSLFYLLVVFFTALLIGKLTNELRRTK